MKSTPALGVRRLFQESRATNFTTRPTPSLTDGHGISIYHTHRRTPPRDYSRPRKRARVGGSDQSSRNHQSIPARPNEAEAKEWGQRNSDPFLCPPIPLPSPPVCLLRHERRRIKSIEFTTPTKGFKAKEWRAKESHSSAPILLPFLHLPTRTGLISAKRPLAPHGPRRSLVAISACMSDRQKNSGQKDQDTTPLHPLFIRTSPPIPPIFLSPRTTALAKTDCPQKTAPSLVTDLRASAGGALHAAHGPPCPSGVVWKVRIPTRSPYSL